MTSKKQLRLAYRLATVLLVIGILSYAAFSASTPVPPVRLMFHAAAGKVLFDHRTHTSDTGYGISCSDCHHNQEPGEVVAPEDIEACSSCHEAESDDESMPNLKEAFHQQCGNCHEDFGAGPTKKDCNSCHVI